MKNVILTAAALLITAAAFSKSTTVSTTSSEFQKYISKSVSNNTSFASEGIEGVVKVRVTVSANGVESASLVSGVGSKIDEQIVAFIKNTPASIAGKLAEDKTVSFIVPVKLVIENN